MSKPKHTHGRYRATIQSERALLKEPASERSRSQRFTGFFKDTWRGVVKVRKYRREGNHPLVKLDASQRQGIYDLRSADGKKSVRIALTADWADGSKNSERVAAAIEAIGADYAIHAGDVYKVGAPHEMESQFLGKGDEGIAWPIGKVGSLAVPGNHEYQSGAHAFYQLAMKQHLGLKDPHSGEHVPQAATYFCLQSERWQVIGLNTGFHSVKPMFLELLMKIVVFLPVIKRIPFVQRLKTKLPKAVLAWLEVVLQDNDKGVIFLSHHQDLTTLDKRANNPSPRRQISKLLTDHRRVLWLCGHGHRLEVHGESKRWLVRNLTVLSRTVGNGSETDTVSLKWWLFIRKLRVRLSKLEFADNRRNPEEKKSKQGFAGFAELDFNEDRLSINYVALCGEKGKAEVVFHEEWSSSEGNVEGPTDVRYRTGDGFIAQGQVESDGTVIKDMSLNLGPARASKLSST